MAMNTTMTAGQHTAGIYSDMTVDGPEIGTLVIIVDRAKNLPNRRTMGKQDPYLAARLGKEARKTKTDFRGGQTPKWDQELRFIVHESPDYHNLKVSVFNDDKRTDLIGEAWIPLWDRVVAAGGGRDDSWHSLSYKGKYAGEVRLEMSFYDSREPERRAPTPVKKTAVKRRPLPGNPSPTVVPQFGPRNMGLARGTTVYLDESGNPTAGPTSSEISPLDGMMQPDLLPQIPPKSSRSRVSLPHAHTTKPPQIPATTDYAPGHYSLVHSHSEPSIHGFHPNHNDDAAELYDTNAGEFADAPYGSSWDGQSSVASHTRYESAYADDRSFISDAHSQVPSHSHSPLSQRMSHALVSTPSPVQSMERGYGSPAGHRSSSRPSSDVYTPSRNSPAPSPLRRELPAPPSHSHSHPHSGQSSPLSRSVEASPNGSTQQSHLQHPPLNRQSVSDPYMTTPPRPQPHPLSQEVRRSLSPQPYHGNDGFEEPQDYHFPEGLSVVRPQAIMPSPRARHSIASIQHHVPSHPRRTRMSDGQSTLQTPNFKPIRNSVSPRPAPLASDMSESSMPFSPDCFDSYNPSARTSQLDDQPSPHSPFYIPEPPARASQSRYTSTPERTSNEPIVGSDGRVIDPSDHLPVDSWAPEPEVKTPVKSYDGDRHGFGPRKSNITPTSGQRRNNIVVNVRTRGNMGSNLDAASSPVMHPGATSPGAGQSPLSPSRMIDGRNRLTKRHSPVRSPIMETAEQSVLREIDVPNPYAQTHSGAYHNDRSAIPLSKSLNNLHQYEPSEYGAGSSWDGSQHGGYDNRHQGRMSMSGPPRPPKIPMDTGSRGYADERAGQYGPVSELSREMAKIDIGMGAADARRNRTAAVGMRYR